MTDNEAIFFVFIYDNISCGANTINMDTNI